MGDRRRVAPASCVRKAALIQPPVRAPIIDALLKTQPACRPYPALTGSRPAAGHRDFLDGVRAIAALWVVLSHLWIIPFGMNAHDGWLGRLTNWTLYSHFAVDVFIVVSGFCLILPVARTGALEGGAWPFFRRRARRILPPFYAALVFSVAAVLAVQALGHHALSVDKPALLANIFLVQDLLPALNTLNGAVLEHCGRMADLLGVSAAGVAAAPLRAGAACWRRRLWRGVRQRWRCCGGITTCFWHRPGICCCLRRAYAPGRFRRSRRAGARKPGPSGRPWSAWRRRGRTGLRSPDYCAGRQRVRRVAAGH